MQMVNFHWWRCLDGYRLERAPPKRWLPHSETRASDQPADTAQPAGSYFGLTNATERFEEYQPLKISALFARFANAESSPDGMKDFCDRFGIPDGGQPDLAQHSGKPKLVSVSVDRLLRLQHELRRALRLFEKGDASELMEHWNSLDGSALIRTELHAGPKGRLELAFAPPDLIQAMWLQFAQHACSATRLFRCERCNSPFVVGSGTGRRSTSKWCSNACKVAAFQERRAQARKETK